MYIYIKILLVLIYLHILLFDLTASKCRPKSKYSKNKRNMIHGRYTRDITDFHIVVPQKVEADGSFYSHHLPHHYDSSVRKKRDLSDCRVHYKLQLGPAGTHVISLEPYPHITAPALLVERRSAGGDLSGVTFHAPQRHLCHWRGQVQGFPDSRVALSSCDGLVGMIRTSANGTFFIEPVHGPTPEEGKEYHHIVYKGAATPAGTCNVRGGGLWSAKHTQKRSDAGTSVQRWYEVMVVADRKFLTFHKDYDVEEYIICIMNIVSDLYHDASTGNLIDINIVRIVYLEKQEDELDLAIDSSGTGTLTSFCKWQANMNPKDLKHPNHHDVGVLFTRHDLCSDDQSGCSLMGLAPLGEACTKDRNCCINEDKGMLLGVVTAHELGHTLGSTHDEPSSNGCEPISESGDSTVMNPSCMFVTNGWSTCSRSLLTGFFDSHDGDCLLDEPQEHSYPLDEMPPGSFYGATEQCKFLFGPDYISYEPGGEKTCQKLRCKKKDSTTTISQGNPPADGTKCGSNKWCFKKECVEVGERPAAINGDWGGWGSWTECSRTCGGGVSSRERFCNNPTPANGGRYCLGKRHEFNICNTQKCSDTKTFREAQCSEFNNKPYQGEVVKWTPYPAPDDDPNPCSLYCISDKRVFTKLAPRVKDGTRCKPGTKDTCIQGSCVEVGCDWMIRSDAVEDVCGICNGDGTHCTIVSKESKENKKGGGYLPLVTVPAGAVNIKMYDMEPNENMIAVSAVDNQTFYLNGQYTLELPKLYQFGGGVTGLYSRPEKDKEELIIRGPTKEPLVLYNCLFSTKEHQLKYSFSIPNDKPMYSPKYHWEFTEWGPCTAVCGGGTQMMVESCIEERDGKVKNSFCINVDKKDTPRARTCNDQQCQTRWKVWRWSECSGCLFQSGIRTRQVECIKENPTNKGDEEIITDPSECCGEKPKTQELCNSPRPCPKNMTSGIVKKRTLEVVDVRELEKKCDSEEHKSFSDCVTGGSQGIVVDHVIPKDIHLEETMLDDSNLNLTDDQIQEIGDQVADKVLSCPIQNLTGQEALARIEELEHGAGYHRNKTHKAQDSKGDN